MKKYILVLLTLLVVATEVAVAQEFSDDQLYSMSLEELMNVKINSVSRKDETLFEAPLSSYTITQAEIQKAGSNSIMEALRLAPGVIVREQTNGVYDIHIRGFDNILRYSEDYTKSNLTTLVMIDDRPVFSHNLGGTLWESLPIDINDVDRIEVVRGPSAAMFGPNAVTGVINIITKRNAAKTWAQAQVSYGVPSTVTANGSFGKAINDKFQFAISSNYQKRGRFDELYYTQGDVYVPASAISVNDKQYPEPKQALSKWGSNLFLTYKPNAKVNFDLTAGLQDAQVQRNFLGNSAGSMFTTNKYDSRYLNLAAGIHGLRLRTAYQSGTDNLNREAAPNQYDYRSMDVVAEYDFFAMNEKIHIVPGASFQTVEFNDRPYLKDGPTFLNGKSQSISTSSAYLRADLKPVKNIRVIAAVRADKFSAPDEIYVAYEFAATYKMHENVLVRAAVTRSNSGSFIANNYLNLQVPVGPGMTFVRKGQDNLDLLTVNMIELGVRSKVTPKLQIDIDVFRQKAENFTALITTGPLSQKFDNVPTSAIQSGVTFALNFVPNQVVQMKPFITIQETTTEDLPSSYLDPAIDPLLKYTSSHHRNTPSFYGGYFVDIKATENLGVNLNGYYFGGHRQYNAYDATEEGKAGDISGKFLTNIKVTYSFIPNLNVYANARNLVNNDSREYFGTDKIGALYSLGLLYKLN